MGFSSKFGPDAVGMATGAADGAHSSEFLLAHSPSTGTHEIVSADEGAGQCASVNGTLFRKLMASCGGGRVCASVCHWGSKYDWLLQKMDAAEYDGKHKAFIAGATFGANHPTEVLAEVGGASAAPAASAPLRQTAAEYEGKHKAFIAGATFGANHPTEVLAEVGGASAAPAASAPLRQTAAEYEGKHKAFIAGATFGANHPKEVLAEVGGASAAPAASAPLRQRLNAEPVAAHGGVPLFSPPPPPPPPPPQAVAAATATATAAAAALTAATAAAAAAAAALTAATATAAAAAAAALTASTTIAIAAAAAAAAACTVAAATAAAVAAAAARTVAAATLRGHVGAVPEPQVDVPHGAGQGGLLRQLHQRAARQRPGRAARGDAGRQRHLPRPVQRVQAGVAAAVLRRCGAPRLLQKVPRGRYGA